MEGGTGGKIYWNPNTLVLPLGSGIVRLFQAYDRRNILATLPILQLIDKAYGGTDVENLQTAFASIQPSIQLADATAFSLWDNAFFNPDFLDRSIGPDGLQAMSWANFLELLLEARVLTDSWPPPTDYHKRHFGDRFRGSFYEQIATESLFQRLSPTQWWTTQKFEANHRELRPTPYRFIEDRFLESYFREHFGGKSVLEIGCGTGYFTAKIAGHARKAVGIDYNRDYVAIARQSWPEERHPNLSFQVGDIIDLTRGTSSFSRDAFDFVVMIDTFLFLFDARYQTSLWEHRRAIMQNVRRLIKPGGLLLVLDPHPLWLTPWLGTPDHPIGILTEYRDHRFKVIPTFEELTTFLFENDMRLRRLLEPQIDEAYAAVNPQDHAFMQEFPQWWFLEIEPGSSKTATIP